MNEVINRMNKIMDDITTDLPKITNKAAMARVRKATLDFEKVAKEFRKVSIAQFK